MAVGDAMSYADRMANWSIRTYVGGNIRKIRNKTGSTDGRPGMTQEAFAELLGTDQSTLSLWESGSRLPRLEDLVGRLERVGIDPRDLVAPPEAESDAVDPEIARTVAALRGLPEDARKAIADLASALRQVIPADYDAEAGEILRLLGRFDSEARAGLLVGIRAMLQNLPAAPKSSFGIE